MTFKSCAAALCLTCLGATAALAVPVDVTFSFDGVSGTITGFDDATAGLQFASSVTFDGALDSYSFAQPNVNGQAMAVFENGALSLLGLFRPFSGTLSSTDPTLLGLSVSFSTAQTVATGNAQELAPLNTGISVTTSDGALSVAVTAVPAVPLPAGGILLVTGLFGAAALGRRRAARKV
ncbi:MAG: hypothetical protein AAF727_15740 [Pseudomonadota bacterium]